MCCLDRCCQGSSCCHSPDPCCDLNDFCCGNPNRCCNPDNPCCGSTNPCCNLNDPCCGNPDPCCNPDNPDCDICAVACCNEVNVAGVTSSCCNDPSPCCGKDCEDNDPCTDDTCDEQSGACAHSNNTAPCDDGNLCTEDDTCVDGGCIGLDKDCSAFDDGDACTIEVCRNQLSGECVIEPIGCDDGKLCTTDCCDPAVGCEHYPSAQACSVGPFDDVAGCAGSTVTLQPRLCNDGACDKTFDWTFTRTGGLLVTTFSPPDSGSIDLPGNTCTCLKGQCGPGDLVVSVNVVIPADATSNLVAPIEFRAISTPDETPPPGCAPVLGSIAAEPVPCMSTAFVKVVELIFTEDPSQKYGFDAYTNRNSDPIVPFKSVALGDTDTAKSERNPASSTDDVFLTSADDTIMTVTPDKVTTSAQTVTVSGVATGVADAEARVDSKTGTTCARMRTSVYSPVLKTVAVVLVHEENDDVQAIPVGQGTPLQHAIRVGPNGTLESVLGGDDFIQVVNGEPIVTTGLNGICDTTATGDDVQIIPKGNGTPNQTCVAVGTNNFRDTNNVDVNDTLDASGINTGPDGVCNSVADNTNRLSTDFGTEASIQAYLNNVIYNQAVVSWDVKKPASVAVNFDLNRDGFLDTSFWKTAEMNAIISGVGSTNTAFVVFFVDNPSNVDSLGISFPNQPYSFVFVGAHFVASVNNTIAHELGHAQNIDHTDEFGDPDPENLMRTINTGKTRLRKNQWDVLNPGTP